jgi:hypothetical protein
MRRRTTLVTLLAALLVPTAAQAQLSMAEALFRNVTDVGFYFGRAGLAREAGNLSVGRAGLSNFGIELLFELGSTTRPLPRPAAADTVARVWTGMQVVRSGERVDTIYTYVIAPAPRPTERLWSYELAIGYGQLAGFSLAGSEFELLGSARELPALTFYASHERTGAYFGIRSGLLQTSALQVVATDGSVISGTAQAFQVGVLAGMAFELATVHPFVEAGWQHRLLPSVEWRAPQLPAGVPRSLDLSGWQLLAGVQIPLRR